MDFDKKEVHSYLDGVPFVIGHKFCPPGSVTLPFAISYQLPHELLAEEYDFSTEQKTLAFCEMKAKEAATIEEEGAKSALKTITDSDKNGGDAHSANANVPLWTEQAILQPQSQMQNKGSTSTGHTNVKKINLSDFENGTPSPFDYMELQTINDMEELNTVFQGLCKNQKEAINTDLDTENETENQSVDKMQNLGNVSKSISFPLPENFSFSNSNISNLDSHGSNTAVPGSSFASSKSMIRNGDSYRSYSYPNVPSAFHNFLSTSSEYERAKINSDNYFSATCQALSQVPCVSSYTGQSRKWLENSYVNVQSYNPLPLRGSKSISDLSSLLPNEEALPRVERSHTPPASVNLSMQTNLSDETTFAKKPFIDDPAKHNILSSNGLLTCTAFQSERKFEFPDPYEELNSPERKIVDSITDMGFHRGQVSRTVKHLGIDEKKVVDHLCQIQALEESGYDRLEAEGALHLHDYDKQEAIRYLDLLNQFQDLGFEKIAIKKALVKNKNDRDKVLDALLS